MDINSLFNSQPIAFLVGIALFIQALAIGTQAALVKEYRGVRTSFLASLSLAIGFPLLVLRGLIPDFLSIVLANILLLSAINLFYIAVCKFTGKSYSKAFVFILTGIILFILLYYRYVADNVTVRFIAINLAHIASIGLSSYKLWQARNTSYRFGMILIFVPWVANGISSLFRVVTAIISPSQLLPQPSTLTIFFIFLFIISFFWTIGFIIMVSQRLQNDLHDLATLDERERMARELHDSVNQSIHSLVLFSETLVSTLEKNNISRARQISERLLESARQALKETRLLLYQTQPSVKERGVNLIEELNARLTNVELRAGVKAQIILEGSLAHCPQEWHENLFWITIEALNNSLKHAQARSIQIIINCYPKYMELEVIDDGRGFDTTRPNAGGYGLHNMQERADLLGGTLTFTSAPGEGTSVRFARKSRKATEGFFR